MRHAFTVLRYTLLRNIRDIPSTAEMILMPLVLIFLLGTVLGGTFDSRDIGITPVTYVVESADPYGAALQEFLQQDEISRYLTVTESSTRTEANQLLEAEEVVTAIIIGDTEAQAETGSTITLIERPGNVLRTGIVRSVLDSFTRGANVSRALATEGFTDAVYEPTSAEFEESTLTRDGRRPGGFDFFAVTMLVVFVMYIAQYASEGLYEDLFMPIGDRVRTTPIAGWEHISGKLAAHMVSGMIQAAILIIVTLLTLGVNWGTEPLLLTGIVFALSTFAVALGGLLLAITRDREQAESTASLVIFGSMILSGGTFQFGEAGPALRALQQLLPNYHGQQALLAMIYGGDPGAIGVAFTYLLGGAALLFTITVFLTRRPA